MLKVESAFPRLRQMRMPRRQNRTHVYLLLLAVTIAAIVAYHLTGKDGSREGVYSHKEYMQLVEESRARRMQPPPADESAGDTRH